MQEELRRCNYLGELSSIYSFAKIVIDDEPTDFSSIVSISSLHTSINVKIKPCLQFFCEMGFLSEEEGFYVGTPLGIVVVNNGFDLFVQKLSFQTLEYLISNQLISPDAIVYDRQGLFCKIKRAGFSLKAAVMRNFLLDSKAIVEKDYQYYDVSDGYEAFFEEKVKHHHRRLTLEQLMEQHKRQEEQGRKAEEFVLEFEKRRLLWSDNAGRVKQISDFDVGAGYDIISFESPVSTTYDRFIEVKSYSSSQSFFWSSNEMKVAHELKDKYYLYLVDMDQYQLQGYEPAIFQDPRNTILNSEEWFVDTASIKVTKV